MTRLYDRLDVVRERTAAELREVHARGGAGTRQALVEREVRSGEASRHLAQLSAVERGLCFGRIDHRAEGAEPGDTYYIGRIGLRDDDHERLLIDWRAPAARPFYAATPGSAGTLVRRRHLHTRERTVVGIDDEVFDLDGLSEQHRGTLVGEAALLSSLRQARTGRMSDVVATIQNEQDRVIRSGLSGVLVVQGGPGTGKTVAALHRAAYLLYTHRDTLQRRGVLVVGPNSTFLRYIGQVLPSLGETDVVLSTVGELFPGVRAQAVEAPAAAVVKGDLRMVELVRAAVRDRQRVPGGDLVVEADGMELTAERAACRRARDRARATRRPHNSARRRFVHDVLAALALDQARRLGRTMDEEDLQAAKAALWDEAPVRAAIDALWPPLSPQGLLTGLFADAGALARAASAAKLSDDERDLLARPPGAEWTTADAPLLAEAAELLGTDDASARAAERARARRRREEERYAEGVLELTGEIDEDAPELMRRADGLVTAEVLAARHRDEGGPRPTTAERAEADVAWAYGHVIVDEAQELSAMAWRAVMRRVPTRSLTVVGDIAQTGSAAGARSWGEMLDPYVRGRWREERLLVNYRTPAEIMRPAADVLRAVDPAQQPPEAVRDGEAEPVAVHIPPGELAERLPALVAAELGAVGGGRLAVITSAALRPAAAAALPGAAAGAGPDALDAPVALLTTVEAKGLEFDAVVVLDPAGILAESPKGGQDLYVAITRAMRRLTVVHPGELPAVLGRLAGRPPAAAGAPVTVAVDATAPGGGDGAG
ncbi:HelD family protein [Allonocardiopsis opalescens]|uniref:HelD family protein n=1 Tax=Allonocardiopsis opalescens TaxID=1144618 RepID=UPI001FE91101|nr:AAA family ATPase [Allonocardiopsis opalescens]